MAKSGIQGLAKGRSDIFRLAPEDITVKDGWNSRDFSDPDNIAHVQTIMESIRDIGILEPITVYWEDNQVVLENGETRLRAVMLLREEGVVFDTIPAQTSSRHASEADRIAAQMVRNSGKPFTVMEQSKVFTRLRELGWEYPAISDRVGLTVERVRQITSLSTVGDDTLKSIQAGEISPTVVQRILAKTDSPDAADKAVKDAVDKAKAEGKSKAGPRHVAPAAKPQKKIAVDYRDLLERLVDRIALNEENSEPDPVTFTGEVTPDLWAAIVAALEVK